MALSTEAAWRAPQLGTQRVLATAAGPLTVFERGTSGRTLVFSHGWLANANLWRHVVEALAGAFRTIVLDLPLGAHTSPLPRGTDLTPDGVAALMQDAFAALDLSEAVFVGNDSGGAYTQIALARDASRAAGLVLNACEVPGTPWPPTVFDALQAASRVPGALRAAMAPLRDPALRMAAGAFGRVAMKPIDATVSNTYVLPLLEDDGVLADAEAVIAAGAGRYVEAAADRLISTFNRPTTLLWAADDGIFPHGAAQAYAKALRRGSYEALPGCRIFVPEDQPGALAERIVAFARAL